MAKDADRYRPTHENLRRYALAPTMRWLIAAALDGATITYGQIKHRLETEENFSTIFSTQIGAVAGYLIEHIQSIEPNAPLINVLVVSQAEGVPNEGAGSFMATRFQDSRLRSQSFKERYPRKWREYFERAAAEVYDYGPAEWANLYARVFGSDLSETAISIERDMRHAGNEDDFGTGAAKYGCGGESEHHKALRLWVVENPKFIHRTFAPARTETEFCLDSGDRIDAVYHLADRTVVLEVKSRISNEVDLRRGVYQCIKYRAVKAAMDVRENVPVEAVLVTETNVSGEVASLLKKHGIRHFLAPLNR
ncbi:hypothetical protein [Paracoccus aeridis]|uniref:hypothetical protein n=1 Tax=Paracoccus aeridis TaxID=1966466 RepID=UPI0010AA5D04|nr:hypothetical protein [Paracoccus aeridis]